MLKIDVRTDTRGLDSLFDKVRKQARFAASQATNRSAKAAQSALIAETDTAFDAVTGYTKKAFYLTPSSKANLTAWIGVKKRQAAWLNPEILGGPRGPGIEKYFDLPGGVYLVPTDHLKKTKSGRPSIAQIKQIAAALKAGPAPTAGRFKGKRKALGNVFLVLPGSGKMHAGVYTTQGAKTVMLLQIVKQPTYRKRFDFYGTAARAVRAAFPIEFRKAFKDAMATAR